MEDAIKKNTIINSLAKPILYMPIYETPDGRHFVDDKQIYFVGSHSVKARKFDTYVGMAKFHLIPDVIGLVNRD